MKTYTNGLDNRFPNPDETARFKQFFAEVGVDFDDVPVEAEIKVDTRRQLHYKEFDYKTGKDAKGKIPKTADDGTVQTVDKKVKLPAGVDPADYGYLLQDSDKPQEPEADE